MMTVRGSIYKNQILTPRNRVSVVCSQMGIKTMLSGKDQLTVGVTYDLYLNKLKDCKSLKIDKFKENSFENNNYKSIALISASLLFLDYDIHDK